jgi:hypothetical protein
VSMEGCQDNRDALGLEDLVKARREFGVAVMDEEAHTLRGIARFPDELAGLLGGTVWGARTARQMDAARP